MPRVSLNIAANGRVVIPAAMRAALGLSAGGKVRARIEDGALVLETLDAVIRRTQALAARYNPEGSPSPVDELIAERRAEALNE